MASHSICVAVKKSRQNNYFIHVFICLHFCLFFLLDHSYFHIWHNAFTMCNMHAISQTWWKIDSERKQEQKNVNHKAEEQRLWLSNWIVLLEFSNLKGRLGGEMKTFIYLYISKWFKDDWTCWKTYSLVRKLAVLLWYTDCQWSLSLLLQSSVLSTFQ